MNKKGINSKLVENYTGFIDYINGLPSEDFMFSYKGKWTAGQQLKHIVMCVEPIVQVLSMPKSKIEHLFGMSGKPSRDYEELRLEYKAKIAEGGKAPSQYLPEEVLLEERGVLCKTLGSSVKNLCAKIDNFSEEELDTLGLPHPLLGRLTIREMLYNVIYHVLHHEGRAKEYLESGKQPKAIGQEFWRELSLEAEVTRKYLAAVPFDKKDFKPAEKSESLGRLAIHVAEIIAWWPACLNADKLDFKDFEPKELDSTKELLAYFDELLIEAKNTLSTVHDAEFAKNWSMTYGEETLFTLPKKQVVRLFCMNHLVHHRAQLGVYLRMLDVAVPATYGPSADDGGVVLIREFE